MLEKSDVIKIIFITAISIEISVNCLFEPLKNMFVKRIWRIHEDENKYAAGFLELDLYDFNHVIDETVSEDEVLNLLRDI